MYELPPLLYERVPEPGSPVDKECHKQRAREYKDALYDDFSTLTNNIITIGQSLNGVDMTEYIKWSPEGYVYDQVNQQ